MARPQWLRGSRKSWERLSFLKLAAIVASHGDISEDFVASVKTQVNSLVSVPYDVQLAQWLSSNGLLTKQELEEMALECAIKMRLQYWWAFNSQIRTGWLSREAVPEYFGFFPRKTGMLEENFDLSELGRTLLLGFISNDEIRAWDGTLISARSPLVLTARQKVFFMYSILRTDGDFLLPLMREWANCFGTNAFTYLDAGKLIPPALDNMAMNFRGSAYSTDDHQEISKIEGVRKRIAEQNEKKIEKQGGGSTREQLCIPRLEWLVDFGVLQKENTRVYRFTKDGLSLTNELERYYNNLISEYYPEDCLLKLLNYHFFGPIVKFLCVSIRQAEPKESLKLLREAYGVAKGTMGYVLLRSLVLLLNGTQVEMEAPRFIEYGDALEAIEAEYHSDPSSVYYTVDRIGNEHQVKFSP